MTPKRVRLIVGLGNPGRSYSGHRHNVGFMVVDELADGTKWETTGDRTQICRCDIGDDLVWLVKPQTYMNLSGKAVAPLIKKLHPEAASQMIVVHDDLDLVEGRVRIKVGGGDGGHKGIRSTADSLRFRDFIRVRLGIGRPPNGVSPEEFVLMNFSPEHQVVRRDLIERGVHAVRAVLESGAEKAMAEFHALK